MLRHIQGGGASSRGSKQKKITEAVGSLRDIQDSLAMRAWRPDSDTLLATARLMIGILEYVIARVAGGDKRSKEKPRRPQRGQVILGRQLTRLTEASRC